MYSPDIIPNFFLEKDLIKRTKTRKICSVWEAVDEITTWARRKEIEYYNMRGSYLRRTTYFDAILVKLKGNLLY